jgi:hypothetical protein
MSLRVFAPLREIVQYGLVIALAFCLVRASAADDFGVESVLTNLHRPCGIAVRPGGTADRYEVFVADTGAGRVIRWSTQAPNEVTDVVAGFPSADDFERFEPQGPVALCFLDSGLLVVGADGRSEGQLLRSYELPEDDGTLAADAGNGASASASQASESYCLSLTRTRANEFVPDALILALHAGESGLIRKSRIQAGIVGQPRPFGKGQPSSVPQAVATSPAGRIVVATTDGQLTFYNPIEGNAELQLATELRQITSLAYSPITNRLYAADLSAGIFRIDDTSQPGKPACLAVRVAEVDRPSAIAFAPDGALYAVTFGDGDNGTLQVVTGDL